MGTYNEKNSHFTEINKMVAVIFNDVAKRPVPQGANNRLAEIRQAIAKGIATIDMAVDIIRMCPYKKAI